MNTQDIIKVRVHDGIVGFLYLGSIGLAEQFAVSWIWVAVAVAFLSITFFVKNNKITIIKTSKANEGIRIFFLISLYI